MFQKQKIEIQEKKEIENDLKNKYFSLVHQYNNHTKNHSCEKEVENQEST
jgi:hypothetical protein